MNISALLMGMMALVLLPGCWNSKNCSSCCAHEETETVVTVAEEAAPEAEVAPEGTQDSSDVAKF